MANVERAEVRSAVYQWMSAHHGLITYTKAIELGMTRSQISDLVQRGRWEVVQRGVYRLTGCPAVPTQQHLAAVWRCGDDAYLTGAPALGLWGIEGFDPDVSSVVLVPSSHPVRGVEFDVRRRPALGAGDRTEWCQVPIATRTRSLVDLAHDTRRREFRVAFDAVKRIGGTDSGRLRRRAEAARPQTGAQYVIELVDSGLLDMESEGERDFFEIVQGIDPPLDVQQRLLPGIRVDFVWLDARLVVEYDGVARHTLATDRAHDRRRRSQLRAAKWEVMVVRKEDLADPARLVQRLLQRRRACLAALAASGAAVGE
jgi:predicted transcriptional regulator of viral defense system